MCVARYRSAFPLSFPSGVAGVASDEVVGAAMYKPAHLIYGVVSSGIPFDTYLAFMRVALHDII